jgi:hypothetical protein
MVANLISEFFDLFGDRRGFGSHYFNFGSGAVGLVSSRVLEAPSR